MLCNIPNAPCTVYTFPEENRPEPHLLFLETVEIFPKQEELISESIRIANELHSHYNGKACRVTRCINISNSSV